MTKTDEEIRKKIAEIEAILSGIGNCIDQGCRGAFSSGGTMRRARNDAPYRGCGGPFSSGGRTCSGFLVRSGASTALWCANEIVPE
jgi:hypothetical protein